MRRIRITLDDESLRRLDSHPEVRRHGRSSVFREAAREWLREKEGQSITARYRIGYRMEPKVEEELAGWADSGVRPEE